VKILLTIISGIVIAVSTLWVTSNEASSLATANGIEPCFGHNGVQEGTANAFECSFKDADEGGTLYWQRNNSDYEWNLHPDSGNLVVNAITTRISAENSYYGFLAVVASAEGGCVVQAAGYDQHPTRCANPGRPPKTMSRRQQRSYDELAEVMREGISDCAWMPNGTSPSKTC